MNVLAKNLQRCIKHKSRLLHFYFNGKKLKKTRSRCKKRRQNVKSNIPNLFDILNNEERQTGRTSNLFQSLKIRKCDFEMLTTLNAVKLGKANNGMDTISKQFRALVKRGLILFMICEDDYFSV